LPDRLDSIVGSGDNGVAFRTRGQRHVYYLDPAFNRES
jgi:hypothetical protein